MDVLVRIDVGRVATDHVAERGKLARHLVLHRLATIHRDDLVDSRPSAVAKTPLAEIEMQPEAQGRTGAAELRRPARRALADHQAGAGHDPAAVGVTDAAVDARALAEVVGIDDKTASGHRISSMPLSVVVPQP